MALKFIRNISGYLLLVLSLAVLGCSSQKPEESPEAVTKRFYDLITASKVEGGSTPASEAYKLINSETANLNVSQFLEIIKNYPPNFKVEVGKAEIKGNQALVSISYKLPSSFGGEYTVNQVVPLNIDPATRTWKIDFAGDTYGMQKDEAIAAHKAEGVPKQGEKQ